MAHYRKIDARLWNDEKFTSLSDQGKLIFLFILTHPNLTMLGVLRLSVIGLCSELASKSSTRQGFLEGLTEGLGEGFMQGYGQAFLEVSRKGLISYDEKACLIWLQNFLRYNPPESPNVIRAWPKVYELVPECKMKLQILCAMERCAEALPEGFQKAYRQVFLIRLPNQEQEQELRSSQVLSELDSPAVAEKPVKQPNGKGEIEIFLPLNDGREFPVEKKLADEWRVLYPAVDVTQELRNQRSWLIANPKNRKTASGVLRFCAGWLTKSQNSAPRVSGNAAALPAARTAGATRGATPDASDIAAQRRAQRAKVAKRGAE